MDALTVIFYAAPRSLISVAVYPIMMPIAFPHP
jgi:hypothetical protein